MRGKIGDLAAREGGNVFPIMTGVAISVLVKTKGQSGPGRIHYAEVPDYLARQEKLDILDAQGSLEDGDFMLLEPNEHGDWLNQRDETYATFQPIGDKSTKGKASTPGIFQNYSRGLATSRDAWCYNYCAQSVEENISRMIANYNQEVAQGKKPDTANLDENRISWNRQLLRDLNGGVRHKYFSEAVCPAIYRPFTKQYVYFRRDMNDMVYQLPQIFPSPAQPNLAISLTGPGSAKEFASVISSEMPDLHFLGAGVSTQVFPLYTWEREAAETGMLDLWKQTSASEKKFAGNFDFTRPIGEQIPEKIGEYRRRDNITGATLAAYRRAYQDAAISKEDIFFYVYALLHQSEYRARYEADLKKMLPRLPKVAGFFDYAIIGRELAELHVGYETLEPYPGVREEWGKRPKDDWQAYRVKKLAWARGEAGKDYSRIIYNEHLTLAGIPAGVNEYRVGGRSPLEWLIDRYCVRVDGPSGIRNDPNDYCRALGESAYIARLAARLVTLSLETRRLVAGLPDFVPLEV